MRNGGTHIVVVDGQDVKACGRSEIFDTADQEAAAQTKAFDTAKQAGKTEGSLEQAKNSAQSCFTSRHRQHPPE